MRSGFETEQNDIKNLKTFGRSIAMLWILAWKFRPPSEIFYRGGYVSWSAKCGI